MNPNLKSVKNLGQFLRWLPLIGSVTLMLIIAGVANASFARLKISNFWQEHTHEVLATAQTFLTDLLNIQGNARDYVFTGQPSSLKTFQESVNTQQVTQLKLLTRDNPRQKETLRRIGADLDEVIAYSQQLVYTRDSEGTEAVVQFESSGQGVALIDRTLADLQVFTDQEHRLPGERAGRAGGGWR